MEKHQDLEDEGEKAMDIRVVAQDTRAIPNSLEIHLVRKWLDIGHQRAVGPRIYYTTSYANTTFAIPLLQKIYFYLNYCIT